MAVAVESVSVIIPAYKAVATLPRIVQAVLGQTVPPAEVIVVSDGALDETPRVAAGLAAEHPTVTALNLPQNVGVARARDAGARAATGEWVLFVDADDALPPTALESLLEAVEAAEAAHAGQGTHASTARVDIAIGAAVALLPDGTVDHLITAPAGVVSGVDAFRRLLRGTVTGHPWNKLIRRGVLEKCLPFAVSDVHSDLSITARAVANAGAVAFTAARVYEYRATAGSILKSGRARGDSLDVVAGVVAECAGRLGLHKSDDYRCFELSHLDLSRLKDAVLGPYDADESAKRARAARNRLAWSALPLAMRRRDVRSAALLTLAKVSLPLYARVLRRGRDATGSRSARMMDLVAKEST